MSCSLTPVCSVFAWIPLMQEDESVQHATYAGKGKQLPLGCWHPAP